MTGHDHRNAHKVRDGRGKWLLRRALDRHLPREVVERPKMGLSVPIGKWLRGLLRDWAESLLDEGRLRREGYFDPAPLRAAWKDHLSGRRDFQSLLWPVLIFQDWLPSHATQTKSLDGNESLGVF